MKKSYNPIEINYFGNRKDYVYYKDSKLFTELQTVFEDLQQSFISEVVSNAVSVPVIYTDAEQKEVIGFGNLDSTKIKNAKYITETIASMRSENPPIKIERQLDFNSAKILPFYSVLCDWYFYAYCLFFV